jgi:hypothetical protein
MGNIHSIFLPVYYTNDRPNPSPNRSSERLQNPKIKDTENESYCIKLFKN